MPTLGERVERRDRAHFVGRRRELDRFDEILDGDSVHVVHLTGVGGIGKSALLREVARRAVAKRFALVWLDGRDLPPFPAVIETALEPVHTNGPTLVVIDSYEMVSSLDNRLRELIIPELPESTIVIMASRQRPSVGWFDGGWDVLFQAMTLDGLSLDELRQLAAGHVGSGDTIAEGALEAFLRDAHGSPLAVVVGAQTGGIGTVAELAERLLGNEVETDRYRTLSVAAIARVTTPELLEAVHPGSDGHESYKWLADRSFSEPLADGIALHALVAESVAQALRVRDPAGEADVRRRIADDVYTRAVAGQFTLSSDLQHLVVDPDVRWGFSADVGKRYRIDEVRDGDIEYIGSLLKAVDLEEWWDVTSVFFRDHPEFVGIARDRAGVTGGYYVAVSPANAPAAAERDVLLGPWLQYCRETLGSNSAVLAREAVDLTGERGEVTALLGAGGILGTGVVNPRFVFLPIAPTLPMAKAFSEALGGQHIPTLDVNAHGMNLECHLVDLGVRGLLGFQRDWIYRETGAVPPTDLADPDPGRLIRLLRDPSGLGLGPQWLGPTPSKRLANLRAMVTEALIVFGEHRDDELAKSIIEAAYLGAGESHETIARRFHLSRSAYFRRLQSATTRVGDELAARQQAIG